MPVDHKVHEPHTHRHGADCGHTAIRHEGHVDYLHDGCLHSEHEGHVDEHTIAVSGTNPAECTPEHACGQHVAEHTHGPTCGHEAVPHGNHVDYMVGGHLHHPCTGHCDDHGALATA